MADEAKKSHNFLIRLRSSVILMIITILSLYWGGIVLFCMLSFVCLVGLFELYQGAGLWKSPLAAAGIIGSGIYLAALGLEGTEWLMPALLLALFLLMGAYVFSFPHYTPRDAALIYFGILYVVVCLSCLYRIRQMEGGFLLVWLVFLASWGCDTLAYCSGILIGKHKMTPRLSPKKTWEGAVGGVLGSMLLGFLYALIFRESLAFTDNPLLWLPLLCGVGAVVSQIGDLAASAIKRSFDIKDFSNLIPGHGGILDRFDSVIVTAPIVYYLLILLGQAV